MYSTNKSITPVWEKQKILHVIDKFPTEAIYKDKVHIDLRGITDIVSNSLELSFAPPEFTDGTTFVPAKGVLSVLGIKENGEADSQSTQVSIRIPIKNIPHEIFSNKLKWICNTYICSYDCALSGGELSLNLAIDGSAIALCEENVEVITSYDINENEDCKKAAGGFSLYYATKGENVWDVAKKHGVSYEKIKKDNAINTMSFEKDTAVILR
jgi:hypothetical protein